jgi:hypothetical protein
MNFPNQCVREEKLTSIGRINNTSCRYNSFLYQK